MRRREFLTSAVGLAAASIVAGVPAGRAAERQAICYNCPPEWADWGGELKNIERDLGIMVPPDNKNSGQALAALIAEKSNPVADVTYLGGQFGPQAKEEGVLAPYKPAHWDEIPAGLKDPDGYWFAIHSGTLGLFINSAALGGAALPRSWSDLLDPAYKGMVGFLDPTSAAVGQVGVIAVNLALGGTYQNLDPGMRYFRRLKDNQPIVPKQTSYARVLSGEIPILFDYDFNAYRAMYTDRAPVKFVIPTEGTQILPYVMGLVAHDPHPDEGRAMLDYVLSDKGQRHWATAFLRPVRPKVMTAEIEAKFLPGADYERAHPLDLAALSAATKLIVERYQSEVG